MGAQTNLLEVIIFNHFESNFCICSVHEQNRPDRDDYVEVLEENIKPNQTHNFAKSTTTIVDTAGTGFVKYVLRIRQSICIPDICHGCHGRHPCKFFLAGINFYRFNAKNWQFTV